MTVQELIDILSRFNPDFEVCTSIFIEPNMVVEDAYQYEGDCDIVRIET